MSTSLQDFEFLGQLGQGMYSTVHKVRRIKDNQIYALKKVKLIEMPQKQVFNAINQVRILASLRHPNVIGYRQAFYDQYDKYLCIVMEYADGGDLENRITQRKNRGVYFKEDEIWEMFGQMLSGLSRLHELGILHRDVKSANFYVTRSGTVKIGDMNVSKVIRKTGMCETQSGAPYYASPQVWRNQAYDTKSDMWSLGCVLYELINLKLPFKARDMEGMFKKVTRGYYSRINKSYSDELSEVLKHLLNVIPKQRKTCKQLFDMPVIKAHMRKRKDENLVEEKSTLLRTIKLSKNLSYVGNSLPKPNYSPLKYKHPCLSQSVGQIGEHNHHGKEGHRSQQLILHNNSKKIDISMTNKISLPPVPGVLNQRKLLRYDSKDQIAKISAQESPKKYRKA